MTVNTKEGMEPRVKLLKKIKSTQAKAFILYLFSYWLWSLVLMVSRGKRETSTAIPAIPPTSYIYIVFQPQL